MVLFIISSFEYISFSNKEADCGPLSIIISQIWNCGDRKDWKDGKKESGASKKDPETGRLCVDPDNYCGSGAGEGLAFGEKLDGDRNCGNGCDRH